MKILSSEDSTVGGKTVRMFTVLTDKKTNDDARRHTLRVHTQYGATDALILSQAGEMFSGLGTVHHVAPSHHREWKVWVEVRNGQ